MGVSARLAQIDVITQGYRKYPDITHKHAPNHPGAELVTSERTPSHINVYKLCVCVCVLQENNQQRTCNSAAELPSGLLFERINQHLLTNHSPVREAQTSQL